MGQDRKKNPTELGRRRDNSSFKLTVAKERIEEQKKWQLRTETTTQLVTKLKKKKEIGFCDRGKKKRRREAGGRKRIKEQSLVSDMKISHRKWNYSALSAVVCLDLAMAIINISSLYVEFSLDVTAQTMRFNYCEDNVAVQKQKTTYLNLDTVAKKINISEP